MEHSASKEKLKSKLEAPSRLRELNPAGTLVKIGFQADDVLCDIGAGTGVFVMPAAEEPARMVYALEVNREALEVIDRKAREAGLYNVQTVLIPEDGTYDVPDDDVDVALLCCVLHEIDEPARAKVFSEVARILTDGGRFAVIEFQPEAEGFGPPKDIRIAKEVVKACGRENGLVAVDDIDLSENLYCLVLAAPEA